MIRLSRTGRVLLWALVLAVLTARATPNVAYMVRAWTAGGPNTTGEAGKVYFAGRIQDGRSPFADGRSPPYYPSFHGVLVHATVAAVGEILQASRSDLYRIGRVASLLMTAAALLLLADLGRRTGVASPLLFGGFLLWIGSYGLVAHTVSYRPDNWLFFLGVLACWLVAVQPERGWSNVVLALLPAVAFHVKTPGVALGAAIVAALVLRGSWRRALKLGVVQATLLVASVLALNHLSNGTYLAGLRSIGHVTFSVGNIFVAFTPLDPVIPWLLFLPLVWLPALLAGRPFRERGSPVATLLVFWLVTLATYGSAAARSGSNTYYYLEPATYGLLLGLVWLQRGRGGEHSNRGTSWRHIRMVAIPVFTALLALPSTIPLLRNGRMANAALYRTERLKGDRERLAAWVNTARLYCYSDDPGLNVLLDRPAVIHPLLQTQMIEAGTLPRSTLLRPVETQEFDCVILSGVRSSYRGRLVLPDTFFSAVAEHYPRATEFGRYQIRYPDQGG